MKRFVMLGLLSLLPARAQIVVVPGTLPTGQVNTPYSYHLTASGGKGSYSFAQISGSFPPGSPAFSLSSAGVISGTPDGCAAFVANTFGPCPNATEPMNSTFTVRATDSLGATGTQTYTIGIYWNPAEAAFLTAVAGYDTNMLAGVNNPPPPPLFGGHLTPAAPYFRQPSTDMQSAWNAWVDGIHAAGATIVDIEVDLDCVFNNLTSCLALYSGAIDHARALGMSISLNPAFYGWKSCGGAGCSPAGPATGLAADCQALIGHAINASPGAGVSDWYACVTTPIPALGMSAYQWMISHWLANGDRFVSLHEPTTMASRWGEGTNLGGCSTAPQPSNTAATCSGRNNMNAGASGSTCPGDWWTNFLQPLLDPKTGLIPAWTASAGISIRTGVTTFLGEDQGYSPTYSALFSSNLPASVDMGFDMYFFKPPNLSVYESAMAVAQQYQHQVFVEEFAPQTWVESGAPPLEPCAIKGCYSCDWQASQGDQSFFAAFLTFAASHGIHSAALFPTQILAGCSPSYPDNCNSQSVATAASANFLAGNRSALSQKLESLMVSGAGEPAAITKSAGDGQSTPVAQTFPDALAVSVADTIGNPVAGASVTFTVTPGATGAGGVFNSGPVVIATGQNGNAAAPALTANSIPGQFTVTATVNALTAVFTLANLGYTLGASSATAGGAAGNGTVLLSGYGPWTAASNSPWLHLAAGSGSGGSSALIQFSYDANANPGVQTGTLTIAGLPFTVTQAGASYAAVYPVTTLVSPGLNLPQAVAVDAQGNVYIADTANNAVKEWIPGTQQTAVLVCGLNAPAGVAVDGQGNVYIADSGNNAIQQWNAATQSLATVVTGLNTPAGVAVDGQGNVYIADSGNHVVKEWNAASQQVSELAAGGLNTPAAVAVDAQGNVYIADSVNNAVFEWSGGQSTPLVSGLSGPAGVAADGQGNVYIADTGSNALKYWSAATQQVTALVSSGLNSPAGLGVDGSGNIYLADTGNSAIKELTPAYLALSPGSLTEVPQAGADSVFAQTLPPGTPLSATSGQGWLTLGTIANGTVNFSFTANASTSARTANITVLGQQVGVTQNGLTPQTITFGPLSNQPYGAAPFPVSAAASSGLDVSFASTTPAVCSVSGAAVTLAAAGTCTIQATQAGNANYAAAPPVDQTFQVTPASQTVAFGALSNQPFGAAPFPVSATASSGLAVSFASTAPAVCAVSGATATLVAAGVCTIRATQAGNANYAAAPPVSQGFQVTKASQTITFGALSNQVFGAAPFTVSATASSGLDVSFASTTPAVCTVSGATVTLVAADACTIQATQAGNANYANAAPVNQTFQVAPASQTITFGARSNQVLGAAPFTVSATASSGLDVSFASTTPAVCTMSGATVTLIAAGTCTIHATQAGNLNWAAATPVNQTFQVTQEGQTITFGPLADEVFGSAPFTINATASSGLAVGLASTTPVVCTVSDNTVTLASAGQCSLLATQAGNATYAAATPVTQSFQVAHETFGATSLTLGSAAGSNSVKIGFLPLLAAPSWSATVNAAWMHLASASGTGAAIVPFTFDANPDPAVRTGAISLDSGVTLSVTQAGTSYIGPGPPVTLAPGLSGPAGVAVDGSGNVYIADTGQNAIQEWIAATQQVTTLAPALLNSPHGVAVDAAGNVYIADTGDNAIKQWSAATQEMTTLVSAGLNQPVAVAVDGSGNVYIADSGNNAIEEWSAATQQMTALVSMGLSNPRGVAVDAAGNVYIADTGNNAVKQWSASVQQVATLVSTGLNQPVAVAVDGSGNVYIADSQNNAIEEWGAATQQVTTLVSTGLSGPSGAAVDGLGNVYIADTGNNAIEEIPLVFAGPASVSEPVTAGSDALLPVLPSTASLAGMFAPSSDQGWLTIGTIANGIVNFSFTANTSISARTANITVLGRQIGVTQNGLTPQTIAFGKVADVSFGAAPFAVSATASSGLAVSFASTTPAVCTVSGATVTLVAAGVCTIQATQAGNANYAAATPVNQSFQVTQAGQTITFGVLSNQPFGTAPFTVSATASSGLAASFASSTSAVCTVSGATVTLVATGTCTIQATQAGNTNYAAATPVNRSFLVTRGSQTITFGTLSNQPFGAAPFPVSATASSGLAVSFASATAAVCTVSGATVTLVATGTCTIQATQAGNTNYAAATPVNRSFLVTRGSQTITFGTLSNQPFGAAPFPVSATASSGLAVSFASTTPAVCAVSGATATLVATGTCTIQATQAGNTNYAAATPINRSFLVTRGSQTISFGTLSNRAFGTAAFPVSATASSGLPVSFNAQTTKVCKISGTTVTLAAAGTCTIKATQAGNTNWAAATPVSQSFQITQGSQTITFGALSNRALGSAPFTVSATASSGLAVSFASTSRAVCTVSGATVTLVAVGTCTIQATQAGNTNWAAATPVKQSFQVN